MKEFFKEAFEKYRSLDMIHFCSFEHVDKYVGKVSERSEIYLDLRRKVMKIVSFDVDTSFQLVTDHRISRFKEDSGAWYFWIRKSFIDSTSDEYFGLGVAKDGQDFWGNLKLSEMEPNKFELQARV